MRRIIKQLEHEVSSWNDTIPVFNLFLEMKIRYLSVSV